MADFRVLIADDVSQWREIFIEDVKESLSGLRVVYVEASCTEQALGLIKSSDQPFDIAIIDKNLPQKPNEAKISRVGFLLAEELRNISPVCRVVMCTGESFNEAFMASVREGRLNVHGFINKGWYNEARDRLKIFIENVLDFKEMPFLFLEPNTEQDWGKHFPQDTVGYWEKKGKERI